jgi:hypothetical protein
MGGGGGAMELNELMQMLKELFLPVAEVVVSLLLVVVVVEVLLLLMMVMVMLGTLWGEECL